ADLQRCRYPDVPLDESAVRHGAPADDRVRREPATAGRPELDGARLQHAISPPEDLGREHPLPRLHGAVATAGRQHRDQGRRWRRVARTQAWRPETARLAQAPPWDR